MSNWIDRISPRCTECKFKFATESTAAQAPKLTKCRRVVCAQCVRKRVENENGCPFCDKDCLRETVYTAFAFIDCLFEPNLIPWTLGCGHVLCTACAQKFIEIRINVGYKSKGERMGTTFAHLSGKKMAQIYADPNSISIAAGKSEKFRLKNPMKDKYLYGVEISDKDNYTVSIEPFGLIPMGENKNVEVTRKAGGPATITFKIFKVAEEVDVSQPLHTFSVKVTPK